MRYAALGDSTATGVGLADPLESYVGIVEARIAENTRRPVMTTNYSVPGASCWLLMEDQLPLFEADHAQDPYDLVTCVIGANDIRDPNFSAEGFECTAVRLFARLPPGTVVSTVPSFGIPYFQRRVSIADAIIRRQALIYDLPLAELFAWTDPLFPLRWIPHSAADLFHPNALGQKLWADSVWEAISAVHPWLVNRARRPLT